MTLEEKTQHDREIKRTSVAANISSAVSDYDKIWSAWFEYLSLLFRVAARIRFIAKHRLRRRASGNVAVSGDQPENTVCKSYG